MAFTFLRWLQKSEAALGERVYVHPLGKAIINLAAMADSIEYELTNFETRTVWKCVVNGHYRHRKEVVGAQPAVCCGQPAILIDRYEQPVDAEVWDEG